MVLPTQPQRGVSPGGMPGPPMQGQGRGPNVGMPRAQSPVPSSVPGVDNVAGTPDPDKIVELFTAYTSGELSRDQLISQLSVLSEGQGGILGLLEDMENPPEGQQDNAMLATSPNPMGGEGLPSISPPGTIPPLEEPLDERHKRIAALIMQYGLTPEDANQMSTELNPRMTSGYGALFQEGPGGRVVELEHQSQVEAMRKDSGNWQEIPADQESNYMNPGGFSIKEPGGGYLGTPTGTFKGMDQSDPNYVAPGGPAEGMQSSNRNVRVSGREPGDIRDRSRVTGSLPSIQPTETGELVWAEELGQMVDSGTMMTPKATGGLDATGLAEIQRQDAQRKLELEQGGAYGDMGQEATRQEMIRQGGAYGDMAAAAPSIQPTLQGGAVGDMSQAATNESIRQGGGAYGDMSSAADTVRRRNYPNIAGDMGQTRTDPDLEARYQAGPTIPEDIGGKEISLEAYEAYKAQRVPGLAQIGSGPSGTNTDQIMDGLNWLKDKLEQTGDWLGDTEGSEIRMPSAGEIGTFVQELIYPLAGGVDNEPKPGTIPGSPVNPYGIQGDLSAQPKPPPDDPLFGAGVGKITGRERGEPGGPSVVEGPVDVLGQAPASYKGTDVTPTEEGYATGITEPEVTGFKTVDDFDVPELKTFLNSLSDEARTGEAGEMLTQQLVDSLTQISQQRMVGNVQLAQTNTQAAIAFLDRAAAVSRESAKQELAEKQQDIDKGLAIGELTGKYGKEDKLTFAAKTEEYRRVIERFAATGEVPQIDSKGNFITEGMYIGPGKDISKGVKATETFEKEMSYAELAQEREISMTETFGRLLNFDRTGKMMPTGGDPLATMETLEAQAFGFTKLMQTAEQGGLLMEYDSSSGKMQPMMMEGTDPKYIDDDRSSPTYNPTGIGPVPIDTMAARRYAWDKDINMQREKWQAQQIENDTYGLELQAATVQYGQQLSALIEAGKLAEAIEVRKEKSLNDKRVLDNKKNEFKVNTLLALANKPSTMLFAQRSGILDDLGLALGVDFSGEDIPTPGRMSTPGQLPTARELQNLSPTDQQIMLAEVAAYDMLGQGYLPVEALGKLTQWQPGSKPIRRTALTSEAR
jgi:hypothetical protein